MDDDRQANHNRNGMGTDQSIFNATSKIVTVYQTLCNFCDIPRFHDVCSVQKPVYGTILSVKGRYNSFCEARHAIINFLFEAENVA